MSIEHSRDANRLIEDMELELASIRAAMELRRLDQAPSPAAVPTRPVEAPATAEERPPARVISAVDLTPEKPSAPAPAPEVAAPSATPRRKSLQERLASLSEAD